MARVRPAWVSVFDFRSVCSFFEYFPVDRFLKNAGVLWDLHHYPYNHTRLTWICKQFPRQFSPPQEMAGKTGVFPLSGPPTVFCWGAICAQFFLFLPAYFSSPAGKTPQTRLSRFSGPA